MSTHVVVIATDLRRTTVKVSPGTYLSDVLQQACVKLKLDSDKYLIKHKQKHVDLSVPFRTAGLVQGAKLELVQKSKTPSAIQVALQMPQPEAREIPGGRLIKKFPSDLTLWQVLRQFESGEASAGKNINITARGVAQVADGSNAGSGQLYYETPVLNLMGRELASLPDFQKTLSQLGFNSGSVLIRLSYRQTDQTLFETMTKIGEFFKQPGDEAMGQVPAAPTETPASSNQPPQATQDASMTGTEPTPAPNQAANDNQQEADREQHSNPAAEQAPGKHVEAANPSETNDPYKPVNVFLAPTGAVPAAALSQAEETDIAPTVAHAQLHQSRLQQSSRNKRLPSDKEIEEKAAAEEARLAAITSVLVKVRFPDNTSSEWQIGPSETGAFLYEAVRHVMASSAQPFHLVLPGSGGSSAIKDEGSPRHNLIRGYKFSGRVLLALVWDDSVPPDVRRKPFLKSNVAEKGQAVKVPEIPQHVVEKQEAVPAPRQTDTAERGGGDGEGKKMPKWFKFGKK